MQVANKYMERCSILLKLGELYIKALRRDHQIAMTQQQTASVGKDLEKVEPHILQPRQRTVGNQDGYSSTNWK